VLAALFVGLYRFSQPATPPAPNSALGRALAAGDIPAACFLLQAATDVDQHGICRTPLHQAALLGQAEVVRTLLDKGAEIDAADDVGQTPLFAAASLGNETVAEVLLRRGASVHARDHIGRTPLHWAAASGCEEMAALLIQHGADPTARDAIGKTPLALAPPADYPYLARLFKPTHSKRAL
jgi:ankyrin repeat protein